MRDAWAGSAGVETCLPAIYNKTRTSSLEEDRMPTLGSCTIRREGGEAGLTRCKGEKGVKRTFDRVEKDVLCLHTHRSIESSLASCRRSSSHIRAQRRRRRSLGVKDGTSSCPTAEALRVLSRPS